MVRFSLDKCTDLESRTDHDFLHGLFLNTKYQGVLFSPQLVQWVWCMTFHKGASQIASKYKRSAVFPYSRMRSDGFDEESQRDYWRPKNEISGALEDDFLKAKSWNKKLYDYEANMPDRFVTKFL